MEPLPPPGGLAGRMVGGFVLDALVGAGGMAEVYRGTDLGLGREVAVKVLPPALARFPVFVARFRSEARAVAALKSPRIVPIYQYGDDDGLLYLVMPLLADSLRGKLQREGLPPLETAVLLVTQVAEALEVAHAAGIMHRDVKPENILLDAHNQPLLSDFGIARDTTGMLAAGTNGGLIATTGPLLGTPQYMAPELLRQQPADQRADVYALGVVLYELLTGQLPHAAPTPYEVVASVLTQPVVPPSVHNAALGPALDLVALTALASDPPARYHSARDFALALQAALVDDRQPRSRAASTPRRGAAVPVPVPMPGAVSRTAATVPAVLGPAQSVGARSRWRRSAHPLLLLGLAAALVVVLALAGTLALAGGVGAPGLGLLPLPGLAAPRSSPTASGSPAGAGTGGMGTPSATTTPGGAPGSSPGTTPGTTPGVTPSVAPTGSPASSPSPSPSASPAPTGTPPTPALAISPVTWQLAISRSTGSCTSVPNDTGGTTVSQTITNNAGAAVSWQWQSMDPAPPSNFQYQLNGGLWSLALAGALPSDLLLAAGATDTLNVRMACTSTPYTITLVASEVLAPPQASYALSLQVPGSAEAQSLPSPSHAR